MRKLIVILIALFLTICISGCKNYYPWSDDLKDAFSNGSITNEMIYGDSQYQEYISQTGFTNKDIEPFEYLCELLTECYDNQDLEKAMKIIWIWGTNKDLKMFDIPVTESFSEWIMDAVLSEDKAVANYNFKWTVFEDYIDIWKTEWKDGHATLICNPFEPKYIAGHGKGMIIRYKYGNYNSLGSNIHSNNNNTGYRTCPNCNGTGLTKTYSTNNILEEASYITCPMCDGTGLVAR